MAKHLKLDLSQILDANGNIDESFVSFEQTKDMKVFTETHPRPAYAIKAIEKLK
jgi:hypothetical protein